MQLHPPMNNTVKWNPEEKIIGVVGVAPAATADFYSKLIRLTPVEKDWEHVRVIIDSNPKIPSRGRYIELGETDPVPYIRQAILQLQSLGAEIIAIPCNTAHILYDQYSNGMSVNIPNMIEVTVESVMRRFSSVPNAIAVFASRLSQKHLLYSAAFKKYGCNVVDTTPHQEAVSGIIEGVKQGKPLDQLKEQMHVVLSEYNVADAFILGCTELSLLIIEDHYCNKPVIDSNTALAQSCLRLANNASFDSANSKTKYTDYN